MARRIKTSVVYQQHQQQAQNKNKNNNSHSEQRAGLDASTAPATEQSAEVKRGVLLESDISGVHELPAASHNHYSQFYFQHTQKGIKKRCFTCFYLLLLDWLLQLLQLYFRVDIICSFILISCAQL